MIEVWKQMVEALEWCHGGEPVNTAEAIQAGKKLIAELESQEPVAWKPIETAPKDGAMLLVCVPRQMNIVVRARYNKLHNFWQTDYEGEGGITRPTYFHKGDLWHPIPPLYTHLPQRKPLTDKQIQDVVNNAVRTEKLSWVGYRKDNDDKYTIPVLSPSDYQFARAIEAAHGIKGES